MELAHEKANCHRAVWFGMSGGFPFLFDAVANAADSSKVVPLRVPHKGIQPQVAVDGKGVVHLVYFHGEARNGDLFYVRSQDRGATFSRPLRVNSHPGSAIAVGNIRGGSPGHR